MNPKLITLLLAVAAPLATAQLKAPKVGDSCQSYGHCKPELPGFGLEGFIPAKLLTLYCDSETKKCAQQLPDGEACKQHDGCLKHYCHEGICARNPEGQNCQEAKDCGTRGDWICHPEQKKCIKGGLGNGEACDLKEQCNSRHCTSEKQCQYPPGLEWSRCKSTEECNGDLVCRRDVFSANKLCREKDGSLFSPCKEHKECETGRCSNGLCVAPPPCGGSGSTCWTGSSCCSKKCSFAVAGIVGSCT